MPKQPPAPKHAPAIPLSGSMGSAFPRIPSLPVRTRTRADVQVSAGVQLSAEAQAREDLITRYFFYAYLLLTLLSVAAMGYALMAM